MKPETISNAGTTVKSAEAKQLRRMFDETESSINDTARKIVLLGLALLEIKKRSEHGCFSQDLHLFVFPEVPKDQFNSLWRKANRYMEVAANVCVRKGVLSGDKFVIPLPAPPNSHACEFDFQPLPDGTGEVSLRTFVSLPPEKLPEKLRAVQMEFWQDVIGKTQRQLLGCSYNPAPARPAASSGADRAAGAKLKGKVAVLVINDLMAQFAKAKLFVAFADCAQLEELERERINFGHFLAPIIKAKRRAR